MKHPMKATTPPETSIEVSQMIEKILSELLLNNSSDGTSCHIPCIASTTSLTYSTPLGLPGYSASYETLHKPRTRRRNDPSKPPRPPNAFILFRTWVSSRIDELNAQEKEKRQKGGDVAHKDHRHSSDSQTSTPEKERGIENDQRHISYISSHCWKTLSATHKKFWKFEAQKVAEKHKKLYPGYKYQPERNLRPRVKRNVKRNGRGDIMRSMVIGRLLCVDVDTDTFKEAIRVLDAKQSEARESPSGDSSTTNVSSGTPITPPSSPPVAAHLPHEPVFRSPLLPPADTPTIPSMGFTTKVSVQPSVQHRLYSQSVPEPGGALQLSNVVPSPSHPYLATNHLCHNIPPFLMVDSPIEPSGLDFSYSSPSDSRISTPASDIAPTMRLLESLIGPIEHSSDVSATEYDSPHHAWSDSIVYSPPLSEASPRTTKASSLELPCASREFCTTKPCEHPGSEKLHRQSRYQPYQATHIHCPDTTAPLPEQSTSSLGLELSCSLEDTADPYQFAMTHGIDPKVMTLPTQDPVELLRAYAFVHSDFLS